MRVICAICKKEVDLSDTQDINSGSRTEHWCWECYLNSQREAAASDMYRRKRLEKMNNSKKRNK